MCGRKFFCFGMVLGILSLSFSSHSWASGKQRKSKNKVEPVSEHYVAPKLEESDLIALQVGNQVFDSSCNGGTIEGIYPDQSVAIKIYTNGLYKIIKVPASSVAVCSGRKGKFKIGSEAFDEQGHKGTIVGFYKDNHAAFKYYKDGMYRVARRKVKSLAVCRGQLGDVHVGDEAIDADGFKGKVAGLYQDGSVAFHFYKNGIYQVEKRPAQSLALTTRKIRYEKTNQEIAPPIQIQFDPWTPVKNLPSAPPLEEPKAKECTSQEDDGTCVICLEQERVVALAPCGHVALCPGCAEQGKLPELCPLCRKPISSTLRIYH